MEDLPLQIGELNTIAVNDTDLPHARGSQVKESRTAKASQSDHQYPGRSKPLLTGQAKAFQQHVSVIAFPHIVGERRLHAVHKKSRSKKKRRMPA